MNKNDITFSLSRLESLREQEDRLFMEHADLEAICVYDDIVDTIKDILTTLVSSYSSGTIASFIENTKYAQIDKAVNNTLYFLYNAEPEQIHDLQVDNASIKSLVCACYKGELKPGEYNY